MSLPRVARGAVTLPRSPGIHAGEVHALLVSNGWEVEAGVEAAAVAAFPRYTDARRHADASDLCARLADAPLHDEAERLRLLRAARARRGAHLRNQAKHGAPRP